jgi:hypothetical protein
MYNLDLTDSTVYSLTVEKDRTLSKTFIAEIYNGDSFTGYFPFSGYTASTLTVKKSPKSFSTLSFSTADNSISFGLNGEFSLAKSADEMFIQSGSYVYEMTLESSASTRGFLRGKFIVVDEAYGEVTDDNTIGSPIRIRVKNDKVLIPIPIVTGSTGSSQYYTGLSPSNITVGGINSGTVLTGKTFTQLFQELLITYLSPSFPSFSITGQATLLEVGDVLAGLRTFTWSTLNSGNIQTNSLAIRDVTTNTILPSGSSLSNTGSKQLNIGTITNTSPISYSWRIEGVNTKSIGFQSSNFTVSSIYPYYYGKVSGSRPTASAALVTGGTKVLANSNGTISITFNATAEYLWFAIPSVSTSKTVWFVNNLNNGSIGGPVSPGGNLFPAFDSVSVTTVKWAGVSYKVYISNFATNTTDPMEMRNS